MGYYDDTCVGCGKEQTVNVEEGQTTWFCYPCEYENEVNQVD